MAPLELLPSRVNGIRNRPGAVHLKENKSSADDKEREIIF